MASLRILAALAALLLAAGCGSQETAAPEVDETIEMLPIAGMYEVSGVTVDKRTGAKREISGKVILAENGPQYTSTFSLNTTFPGGEDPIQADVIGTGSGKIEGRTLTGTAETQIVMGTVPGVDPGFAFIPRLTTTRIVSKSVATIAADGTVQIEIESEPDTGEHYSPTRTAIRGKRVSSAGLGDKPLASSRRPAAVGGPE